MPNLHETRAVEAVPLFRDEEVEAGEERPKDDEGAKDGEETDIEESMKDRAGVYLDDGSIFLGIDSPKDAQGF